MSGVTAERKVEMVPVTIFREKPTIVLTLDEAHARTLLMLMNRVCGVGAGRDRTDAIAKALAVAGLTYDYADADFTGTLTARPK